MRNVPFIRAQHHSAGWKSSVFHHEAMNTLVCLFCLALLILRTLGQLNITVLHNDTHELTYNPISSWRVNAFVFNGTQNIFVAQDVGVTAGNYPSITFEFDGGPILISLCISCPTSCGSGSATAVYFFVAFDASIDQNCEIFLDDDAPSTRSANAATDPESGIAADYALYFNKNLRSSSNLHTLVAQDVTANMLFQSIIYT